jgi:hypothetical protein
MSYGHMLKEEKRLKAEIEKLLQTAEATDEHEDQAYGPQADGYHVGAELSRREHRLKKLAEAKAALEAREKREHPDEPIDPKKQISFADHDARCFSKPGEGTRYVYNAQAAVDMDSQIIVANRIEDSVSDAHAAEPALENMERELDQVPRALVTDAGYGNQNTLESCRKRGVTPVCATAREGKEDRETGKLDRFSYDRDQDRFVCAHGHAFVFTHEHPPSGVRTYKTTEPVPCTCGHQRGPGSPGQTHAPANSGRAGPSRAVSTTQMHRGACVWPDQGRDGIPSVLVSGQAERGQRMEPGVRCVQRQEDRGLAVHPAPPGQPGAGRWRRGREPFHFEAAPFCGRAATAHLPLLHRSRGAIHPINPSSAIHAVSLLAHAV